MSLYNALLQSYLSTGVSPSDLLEQAKNHRVLALLAKTLHDVGITQDQVEKKPVFYLLRHAKLRAQLQELDNALHQQNHKVVLIKGAIQLFRSTYPHAGMRDMADIDVLINDANVLKVFKHLGYAPQDKSETMPTSLSLPPGEHHLPPLWRDGDLATIEPHVLAVSPQFIHLLPDDIVKRSQPANGTKALLLPDPTDQLFLALIHTFLHDRASMHGGLFIRSIVECELLFEALSPEQQQQAKERFSSLGGNKLWDAWRGLADWCFHHTDGAQRKNWRTRMLIKEFQLREKNNWTILALAITHLGIMFTQPAFWRTGKLQRFSRKLLTRGFWNRLATRLRISSIFRKSKRL